MSHVSQEEVKWGGRVQVDRPVYSREELDDRYGRKEPPGRKNRCCRCTCPCSARCVLERVLGLVPFIETVRTYKWRRYLVLDAIAGVSVAMVHIPQGMGFALLAGVAPVYGLYASFWQVLIYMFLGSCRHLSVGTMALISLIIGAVVEREVELWNQLKGHAMVLNATTPGYLPTAGNTTPAEKFVLSEEDLFRSSVATGVSLIASVTMLAMGLLRLGVVTSFMPKSFISGFTTAAAFHIVTTQVKPLLHLPAKRHGGVFNFPMSWYELFVTMPQTNMADLIITIFSFIFLISIKEVINVKYRKKLPAPIPAEMILVVLGTLVSYLAHLSERWDVKVVGFIPKGIPAPALPNFDHVTSYIPDGIAAGVTSFAISISMVDILSKKHRYKANVNGELVAYGVAYGASSFLHCFAGAAAPPRCFVMEMSGGKTQMASAFTSVVLLLVLLVIAPVLKYAPNALLASIIVVALFPLFKQFRDLANYWRLSKPDLIIWVITFLVSVFVDISIGLGAGIVVAVMTAVFPAMCARGYRLGQTEHSDLYVPLKTHKALRANPQTAIFRYECTLYFVTINNFKKELFKETVDPMQLLADRNKENEESGGKSDQAVSKQAVYTNGSDKHDVGSESTVDRKCNNQIPETPNGRLNSGTPPQPKVTVTTIILDCSPIGYIDYTGVMTLRQLHDDYKAAGIEFLLADCNPFLLRKLQIDGLTGASTGDVIPVFPSVQDAINRSPRYVFTSHL